MSEETHYQRWKTAQSPKYITRWLPWILLVVLSLPYILTQFSLLSFYTKDLGEIGDIIGGTTAPFIGFMGIIVTFHAFWVQYQANYNQRTDLQLERFENQFYEMVRIHANNIQEMDIDNQFSGRKVFVRMFDEFKYIYLVTYQTSIFNFPDKFNNEMICDISYKLFFHGIGSEFDNKTVSLFDELQQPLVVLVCERLRGIQKEWDNSDEPTMEEMTTLSYNHPNISDIECKRILNKKKYLHRAVAHEDQNTTMSFEIFYYPFDGNINRLGHYYRHLYQAVSFVVESKIVPYHDDKYRYLKLLRAQLSNHEQLLLYYNSLSKMGMEWITNNYFTTYRMIKNLPLIDADFGIHPVTKLGALNERKELIFEWHPGEGEN